jgi:restriction endonuclease S subunit
MKNISQKYIRSLQIALPKSLNEQEIIRVRLDSILQRIWSEKNARNKLTQQKSGLMHDLLTGTVRVNIDPV